MKYKSFQKFSIVEVSQRLDIQPQQLARHLGHSAGLPNRLRFDEADIEKIYVEMGLKTWWEPNIQYTIQDDNPNRRLIREFANRMLDNGLTQPQRSDTLLRGIGGQKKALLRTFLNELVKLGVLFSQGSISSVNLRLEPNNRTILEQIASDVRYPPSVSALWEG